MAWRRMRRVWPLAASTATMPWPTVASQTSPGRTSAMLLICCTVSGTPAGSGCSRTGRAASPGAMTKAPSCAVPAHSRPALSSSSDCTSACIVAPDASAAAVLSCRGAAAASGTGTKAPPSGARRSRPMSVPTHSAPLRLRSTASTRRPRSRSTAGSGGRRCSWPSAAKARASRPPAVATHSPPCPSSAMPCTLTWLRPCGPAPSATKRPLARSWRTRPLELVPIHKRPAASPCRVWITLSGKAPALPGSDRYTCSR